MTRKKMNRKKYGMMILWILIMAYTLSGCSGNKNAGKVSMYDLKDAMAASTESFGDMTYVSSEDKNAAQIFTNISGMDYENVKAFFIYYATDGTGNADEIAVIQVKKSRNLTEARESLEAHLDKRKSLYSTYDKTQLKKLEAARVLVNRDANCTALVVGDDVEKLSTAFHDYLNSR